MYVKHAYFDQNLTEGKRWQEWVSTRTRCTLGTQTLTITPCYVMLTGGKRWQEWVSTRALWTWSTPTLTSTPHASGTTPGQRYWARGRSATPAPSAGRRTAPTPCTRPSSPPISRLAIATTWVHAFQAPTHLLTRSCHPISRYGKPVERTNKNNFKTDFIGPLLVARTPK